VDNADLPSVAVRAADVVLFPGGAPHAMHDGSRRRPKPLKQTADDFIRIVENAGKGAVAHILCGQFVLPPSSQRLVQVLLPERLIVRACEDPGGTCDIRVTEQFPRRYAVPTRAALRPCASLAREGR